MNTNTLCNSELAVNNITIGNNSTKENKNIINDIKNEKITTAEKRVDKSQTLVYFEMFVKRLIDIVAGVIGCILMVPLTIVIYIANKICNDTAPIFFVQERIGKNGKTFKIYKYRTMVENADEILNQYLEKNHEAKIEYIKNKKLKEDPRITKVGKILRATSLDEWPQFLNCLIGNMSLVGPRPYLLREKEDIGNYYSIIIKHKPGITGLWQTHGRSEVTFKDRLHMDYLYNQNNSLIQDFKIIINTFKTVLNRRGAI